MIQEEVADRLCAAPGGKACGAITAVLNYYGTPEKLFTVRSDRFIPEPKVDSAVVRIKLHKDKPYKPLNEDIFFKTIRGAFEQRRKTLPNSLSSVFGEISKEEITDIISQCGLDVNIRGERLTMDDLCNLSDKLYNKINS
jgi:16S rRNA (adenine1518-N6/adenine1519-N6)-dimethyltransferase